MNDKNKKFIEKLMKENEELKEKAVVVEERIEMMKEKELNSHQTPINKGYLKRMKDFNKKVTDMMKYLK